MAGRMVCGRERNRRQVPVPCVADPVAFGDARASVHVGGAQRLGVAARTAGAEDADPQPAGTPSRCCGLPEQAELCAVHILVECLLAGDFEVRI